MTLCLPAPLRVNRVKALFVGQSVKYLEFGGSILAMELYLGCVRGKSSWTCRWPRGAFDCFRSTETKDARHSNLDTVDFLDEFTILMLACSCL